MKREAFKLVLILEHIAFLPLAIVLIVFFPRGYAEVLRIASEHVQWVYSQPPKP